MVELQYNSFLELFKENGFEFFYDIDHFQWKYNPPSGNAKIAVVYEDKKLIAMNSMFPVIIQKNETRIKCWQSCDTATLPSARGKGYFTKCLEILKSNLKDDEIFWGFPNSNSIRGFEKLGWSEKGTLNTFFRIIPSFFKVSGVSKLEKFDSEQDAFYQILLKQGVAIVEKTSSYLNWRYVNNPKKVYSCFVYKENGNQLGYLILREIKMHGRSFGLILEIQYLNEIARSRLLQFASNWSFSRNLISVFMMDNTTSIGCALSSLYFKIPNFLMPKRQVLMAQAFGDSAVKLFNENWSVQIGDWDGF